MRARLTPAVLTVVFLACSTGFAAQPAADFVKDVAHYFTVTEDVVEQVMATGVSQDDVPVAFYCADKCEMSPVDLAHMRARGDGWSDIATMRGIGPRDFYVIVVGDIKSETYAPIFEKYKSTPINLWRKMELTDSDIINLVNLRFVGSEHDYSVYEIMELRDSGSDFMAINQEIKHRKAELVQLDRDQRLREARASKSNDH
jgi:hypothetical protein